MGTTHLERGLLPRPSFDEIGSNDGEDQTYAMSHGVYLQDL